MWLSWQSGRCSEKTKIKKKGPEMAYLNYITLFNVPS